MTESSTTQDERLQSNQEALEAQLDLIVKLGIENVMISRALAMARGRPFLLEAQQAAREYFANRSSENPTSAARAEVAVSP
jgi:hypothetical protein